MNAIDENTIGESLTEKQERFCRNYTQNYEFFGNATYSYEDAYGFDIEAQPKDDAVYKLYDGREIDAILLEDLPKSESSNAKKIKDSSRDAMYNYCSRSGWRLRRNEKIQKRCRELLNEFMIESVIDARLTEIIMKGDDTDSIAAIKEFNKLKQRIVEKKDITSGGKTIEGFNFIKADEPKNNPDNPSNV